VLVATNTIATNALRAVTSTVPIIFVNVTDPVGNGLVPSLTHPGGNLTGYTDTDPAIAGKWGELLKRLVPGLHTVVLVYAPDVAPWAKVYFEPFETAVRQLALTGRIQPIKAREDYESVFNTCGRDRGCSVILIDDAMFARNLEHIVALARDHKVPAMYTNQGYVITFGALIAYGLGLVDLYVQSADYVDKILKGANPGDLPVQMPATYRMAVNLKTAAAIGLEIPSEILAQADRVVE
jgi:putative ABC transport system substrate-binding protein